MESLTFLRRRWWIVLAFLVVGIASSYGAFLSTPPTYAASSQLLLTPLPTRAGVFASNDYVVARANAYAAVANSPQFRVDVLSDLGEANDSRYPLSSVSVNSGTALITIIASDTTADSARRAARAVGDRLATLATQIDGSTSSGARMRLDLVSAASLPYTPTAPDRTTFLAVGALAGLVLGLAVAYASSRSRTAVKVAPGSRRREAISGARPSLTRESVEHAQPLDAASDGPRASRQ